MRSRWESWLSPSSCRQKAWRFRFHNRANNIFSSNIGLGGGVSRIFFSDANSKIVFADEPTGNLDSHTGEVILELFRKLSQEGRTIALVTHDPEIAAVTPRRIEIRDGKISKHADPRLAGLDRANAEGGRRSAEQNAGAKLPAAN